VRALIAVHERQVLKALRDSVPVAAREFKSCWIDKSTPNGTQSIVRQHKVNATGAIPEAARAVLARLLWAY
jgi:hypothetical protein